ncbi:hypothetical protein VZT92_017281 [Zoarces viviparus]|uniref:C-type lectin domain-containing protein n=1 Tax=Zoarces viviparus TaxID=48416 RepID=A0AAW1EQR7_ZOAVI
MQWSLFVLILMGQCSFCLCRLYEYHFVEEKKTWDEARTYCRDKYTDLAKVFDMTDMKRLNDSAGNQGEAWIGLHNQSNVNRTWLWSLPGVKFNDSETEWDDGKPNDGTNNAGYNKEPNDLYYPENCVMMKNNHKWFDVPCTNKHPFICYDEPNQNKFHLIDERKTWLEAQSYCREHHTDLISVPTQLNHEELKNIAPNQWVWIGLFRDTWRWSDGSSFSFRSWDPDLFEDEDGKKCAMTVSNGKWSSDNCSNTKPFYCYARELVCDTTVADEVILINEKMTWEQAVTYCRMNHSGLISITNPQKQRWAEEVAKQATSTHVWTGLRFNCKEGMWFWVTGKIVCYNNWGPDYVFERCGMSGVMETGGDHKWSKKYDSMEFSFICTKR